MTTSLADLVAARGVLRPGELVTLAVGLAEDLRAVHEAGGAHGYVEARRVLLVAGGRPVLVPAGDPAARPADDVAALAALLAWAGGFSRASGPSGVTGRLTAAESATGGTATRPGSAVPHGGDPASDPAARRVAAVLARAAQPSGPQDGDLMTLDGLVDALSEATPAMALRLPPLPPPASSPRPQDGTGAQPRRLGHTVRGHRHARASRADSRPPLARALGLGMALVAVLILAGTLSGRADPPARGVGGPVAARPPVGGPVAARPPAGHDEGDRRQDTLAPLPSATGPVEGPPCQGPGAERSRDGVPATERSAGQTLRLLDAARCRAYASGDASALAALYLPGSAALARDLANLTQLRARGLVAWGFRIVPDAVRVVEQRPGWVRLRVVDHIPAFPLAPARPGGAAGGTVPGRGPREFDLTLVRTGASNPADGWVYAQVSATGSAPATISAAAAATSR